MYIYITSIAYQPWPVACIEDSIKDPQTGESPKMKWMDKRDDAKSEATTSTQDSNNYTTYSALFSVHEGPSDLRLTCAVASISGAADFQSTCILGLSSRRRMLTLFGNSPNMEWLKYGSLDVHLNSTTVEVEV